MEADQKAGTGTLFVDTPEQVNSREYAGVVVAGFLSAVESRIRNAMKNNDLTTVRIAVNGATNGLPQFEKAMAAGRAVVGEAIIRESKAAVRRKRTHHSHHHRKKK
jgi:predicted chitinase